MPRLYSDSPDEFRYIVLALQRQGARQLSRMLGDVDLTPSQAEALSVIGDFGPMTIKSVGQHLVCESGSPSRLVSTLATKGLITRAQSEDDRRAILHALTSKGRKTLAKVREIHQRFNENLEKALLASEAEHPRDRMKQLSAVVVDPELRAALDLRFPA